MTGSWSSETPASNSVSFQGLFRKVGGQGILQLRATLWSWLWLDLLLSPSSFHMLHAHISSTLQICSSWRKSTQLSVFSGIATTIGFCKQKETQFPSSIQSAVCLVFLALNHGYRNGDELQSCSQGRRCHHQHCRDGPQKRLKCLSTHLRVDFII